MNIFGKYLRRSMMEKKGRTLLLLISISISAALLIASLGSVKALLGTFSSQIKENYAGFNVSVSPSRSLGVPLFDPVKLDRSNIKDSFSGINAGGYIPSNNKEFLFTGVTLTEFNKIDSMKILKKVGLDPFVGKKLILSEKTSKLLKKGLGDIIKLNVMGIEDTYTVAAISTDRGLFLSDSENQFRLITPLENLEKVYHQQNKYSFMFLKVDHPDLAKWVKEFNEMHKAEKIVAAQVFDEKQIEQQAGMVKMPLYFMLAIVLIMTTFIIFSSFKLIITERMSTIGVFLSQGATKGRIMSLLLVESLIYGIIGGILGNLMGAGLTRLISVVGNPMKEYGIQATTEYYLPYFVAGFVFAIVLSLISTTIPILSIRKLPVKDVILNTLSTSNKVSMKTFLVGVVFVAAAVALHVFGSAMSYKGAIPAMLLGFFGIIMVIPKLVDTVFHPMVRMLRNINGVSMLSFNNVRTSRVLINNIRLIAVSVISIVMITALSFSITDVVKGAYEGMNFDVSVSIRSNNIKNAYETIKGYNGIESIHMTGGIMTNLDADPSKLVSINYIDPEAYKSFENYAVFGHKEKELDALKNDEDGIILAKQIAERYGVKPGDTITLSNEYRKEKFKVLSVFNAKLMDSGNYNLISMKAALKHFDIKYPTQYFINTKKEQNIARDELDKKLKGYGATIITKKKMSDDNEKGNKQMTDIMGIFSYITMIIGAFGIVSNVTISFIQRKREIAVMSSVGMTQRGRGYMIFLESVFQAFIGAAISLVASYGIVILFGDVFKFIVMEMSLKFPYQSIAVIVGATVVLMLVTSLSSIFKSRKLQIVQELRYE